MRFFSAVVLFFLIGPDMAEAQGRRDSNFLNTLQIGGGEIKALEFGFGLFPPIRFGKNMLINSFSGHQWELNDVSGLPLDQLRFSQYRYTPMLIFPREGGTTFTAGLPMTFAAMEHTPRLRNDAYFNSVFLSYSGKSDSNPDASWSFGLIFLDKSRRRQVFPTGSYSYGTDDKKWRFAFGFPFAAVTYFPHETVEVGTFLGRDTSHNLIPEEHPLAPQGRYLEQEQLVVGLGSRFHLPRGFKLNVIVASMLNSHYRFLDSDFNANATIKEHRDLGYLKVGLSWSPVRPAASAAPDKKD